MTRLTIYYKTKEEIELIRESALLVSRTLGLIAEEIQAGITTEYLDKLAETFIRDHGGIPSFKGYGGRNKNNPQKPYPATLCISINDEVVHGIPSKRVIKEGDIVSVDCGVYKNGFHGDHAYTFPIGDVKPEVMKLLEVTKECLYIGIAQMKPGNRICDISLAIQRHAEKHKFGVVRELCGHGLGKNLHEMPSVPNHGREVKDKISEGMVLAIEPMINLKNRHVKEKSDFWTIHTVDGQPSAHYEHDVAILNGKTEILSTFDFIYEALAKKQGKAKPDISTLEEARLIAQKYNYN
ncbi:MAG: type I methionyl aminopeptidase [Cytophagales bacterium]|nr:type I methionyl aminopeptidase [Cytophagales bacterium]MDW8384761.1 type I methionyl aminopeptidase [Flammeovirgaceae bacterium]